MEQGRFVQVLFHVDTNCVNARNRLPNMNQLEAWHKSGVILLERSRTALRETSAGGSAARSRKAGELPFTDTSVTTVEECHELRTVEAILFPGGARTQSQRCDVDIVFNAKKYGAILVTNDGASNRQPGGILGHREELRKMGFVVMTDEDAVALVKEKIADRDELLRQRAKSRGFTLPDWVGLD